MFNRKILEPVCKNISKHETRLRKYLITTGKDGQNDGISVSGQTHENGELQETAESQKIPKISLTENQKVFSTFAEATVSTKPKLCTWTYANEEEIKELLTCKSSTDIRKTIDKKFQNEYPKGISRILLIELIYTIVRYCQRNQMNLEQSATILSLFYLTHQYFSSSFNTETGKVYYFFKQHMLLHCIDCPPESKRIFSYEESKKVVRYFCGVYLKNLPLVRLMCLPNFGFLLNYPKPPPDLFGSKGTKDTKGKKDKKKKKK